MTVPNTRTAECYNQAPQHSDPGTAQTAPGLTPLVRSDAMSDDTRPVPARLRFEILRRDGHRCHYCGASADEAALHVDHVIPRALGGTNEPSNLVTACAECNGGKTSTAPDQDHVEAVDERATKWAAALQQAAELERANRSTEHETVAAFYDEWRRLFRSDTDLQGDWELSIETFAARGLSAEDLAYAAERTQMKGLQWGYRFKYFCGVCWRMISDRQQVALEILEGEKRG